MLLSTRRGAATFRAQVSEDIRADTVFVPFHWGGASAANALTNPALDPQSKMPAFKVCAVAVARLGAPDDDELLTRPPGPHRATRAPTQTRRSTNASNPPDVRTSRCSPRTASCKASSPSRARAWTSPRRIAPELAYVVPEGVVSQALYFRGGNSTDELVSLVLMRDGVPMRYFPIGAKSDVHVPLRVVEDIDGGSVVELRLARAGGAHRHPRDRPGPGGALMTLIDDRPATSSGSATSSGASSSSATGWPAPGRSRRSSPAAARSCSTSRCSATSRTATTTGSCSATSCRARRATTTST